MTREHMTKRGHDEGMIDRLYANEWTTIEERANDIAIRFGYYTFKKYFVKAYITEATKRKKYLNTQNIDV
jgi:hypothetical protein